MDQVKIGVAERNLEVEGQNWGSWGKKDQLYDGTSGKIRSQPEEITLRHQEGVCRERGGLSISSEATQENFSWKIEHREYHQQQSWEGASWKRWRNQKTSRFYRKTKNS